jgi:hypothetical protein
LEKLYRATVGRFQLTTDGWRPYVLAVWQAFGRDIDHAQVGALQAELAVRHEVTPFEVAIGTQCAGTGLGAAAP